MQPHQPRILLIEDDIDTADLVIETLQDHFGPGCVRHVNTIAKARQINLQEVDLVLSDMNLPDGNGLEVLELYQGIRPDLPIVFVTGESILENAIFAVRNGAYDYVVKAGDYLFSVPVIIEKNLELWRIKQENIRLQQRLSETLQDVSKKNEQLSQAVDRLETMAATDPLTGLSNRRSLNKALQGRFAEAQRTGRDLSVIMMDLDGFKQLNDTAGHPAGDRVLVLVARAIEANCRRSDIAGRFGGDEFIVLLPNTDEVEAIKVGERIRIDFAQSALTETAKIAPGCCVTISMGVSTLHRGRAPSGDQLVAQADHALYAAKARGKSRLVAYPLTSAEVLRGAHI
jgi:diguanylate cyclase (GGDEF)-like protein